MSITIRGKVFFTVNEVAEEMNISHQTVRNMIDNGDINATWIGGRVFIPEEELEEFMETIINPSEWECDECGQELNGTEKYCPNCGSEFED